MLVPSSERPDSLVASACCSLLLTGSFLLLFLFQVCKKFLALVSFTPHCSAFRETRDGYLSLSGWVLYKISSQYWLVPSPSDFICHAANAGSWNGRPEENTWFIYCDKLVSLCLNSPVTIFFNRNKQKIYLSPLNLLKGNRKRKQTSFIFFYWFVTIMVIVFKWMMLMSVLGHNYLSSNSRDTREPGNPAADEIWLTSSPQTVSDTLCRFPAHYTHYTSECPVTQIGSEMRSHRDRGDYSILASGKIL